MELERIRLKREEKIIALISLCQLANVAAALGLLAAAGPDLNLKSDLQKVCIRPTKCVHPT